MARELGPFVRTLPAIASLTVAACVGGTPNPPTLGEPSLVEQQSGSTELLQAVSVVDERTVWVSGHGGAWARTTDGGVTWETGVVAGADTLQFRDVHAVDAQNAWLLSAGSGVLSRIYRTADGGATWTLQWTNPEPAGFYDCLDFWDRSRGFAYGDAVDGALRVLVTVDGGATWELVPAAVLPPALAGEGGFAASGTCAIAGDDGRGWIAAGNAGRARVFVTDDYGATWEASDVPVETGQGAGLTSISMVDALTGTAFGGNLAVTDARTRNLARTEDGGHTWEALPLAAMSGAMYGGVHVPGTGGRALIAVGPGGADISLDGGATWSGFDRRSWWGVGSSGPGATWITGPDGRIARVDLRN